jgi:hypothetical protein
MVKPAKGWLSSDGLFFEDKEAAEKHELRQTIIDVLESVYGDEHMSIGKFVDHLLKSPKLYISRIDPLAL